MFFQQLSAYPLALFLCLGTSSAEGQTNLRIKALPLGDRGVIEDFSPGDWKIKLGGKNVNVVSQRLPKDLGKEGQNWVFVFMPVRDPEMRQLAVQSVATFMVTLPATDSVLVVVRTEKGLECFTPGFTTRPVLWEKALGRVLEELPARLAGNPEPTFSLPAPPTGEKEEGIEPIQQFLAKIAGRKMERSTDDVTSKWSSIVDSYSIDSLGGYAKTIATTMESLERFGEALAKSPGEKHILVFSRNEIDDLANPAWARKVTQMSSGGYTKRGVNEVMAGRDVLNSKLQTEMMIRDVTLARISLSNKLTQLGLTMHSVGGGGANYFGAFAEAAVATGGYQYRFDTDLVARLSQLLPLWATRYELEVALPSGVSQPTKIQVETTRKNVRMYAPFSN